MKTGKGVVQGDTAVAVSDSEHQIIGEAQTPWRDAGAGTAAASTDRVT
jgi:hypothetical protein